MSADHKRFVGRARVFGGAIVIGFVLVAIRLGQLQIHQHAELSRLAEQEYLNSIRIPARRGNIYDRLGKPLAIAVDVPSVYANPMKIADARDAARRLSRVLDVSVDTLYGRLASERRFVWLERYVTPDVAKKVRALQISGVDITKESKRFYPNREVAAHIVGFAGVDAHGLEGLEKSLDAVLAGEPQVVSALRDARGRRLLSADLVSEAQSRGADVTLTLDLQIQHAAEASLAAAMQRTGARAAVAVVLDVESAGLLAVATQPDFNPNDAASHSAASRRSRAITDMFEPGSTVKPLTIAAALDAGVLQEDAKIFCENGQYAIGRHTVRDGHRHGWLTLEQIIQKSSNVGAAKVGEAVGRERLWEYLHEFGFGQRPGLTFPGETGGMLRPAATWSDVGLATIAFGHGVAVSAIQMAAAYRVLAAGGVYRSPTLVERTDGTLAPELSGARPDRRVISRSAADRVLRMMEAAVSEEGTGWRADIAGYRVAGKTGTAQKIDPVSGGYSVDRFVAVFGGVVPADEPKVVIVVAVDEPNGAHTGGEVAAPIFAEIADASMRQLGVPPSGEVVNAALMRARGAGHDEEPEAHAAEGNAAKGDGHTPSVAAAELLVAAETQPLPLEDYRPAPGTVPSFLGLTARQVMERYAELSDAGGWGLDLKLEGSGRVVRQHPAPGSRTEGERQSVSLTLAMTGSAGMKR